MNFSQFTQEAIANWLNGTAFPAAPVALEIGLSTADPLDDGSGLVEPPAVNGYARVPVTFGAPVSTLGNGTSVFNTAAVSFPTVTGANWPAVTHAAIFDAGTGDMLFHGPINAPRVALVGESISFAISDIQPQAGLGRFSHYMGQWILGWLNGAAAPAAPATTYLAISRADPLEDASLIDEPNTIFGYARQAITWSAPLTTISVGTQVDNSAALVFGPAVTTGWLVITHAAIYDALSGGNQLIQGAVVSSRTVPVGDAYAVSVGAISALIR